MKHLFQMNEDSTLIADSGSTKTDWTLWTATDARTINVRTQGINPYMIGVIEISRILREELLPALPHTVPARIRFYGAGCRGTQTAVVHEALLSVFPRAHVEVCSDLLGAAKALCGKEEGIACILGTGENSCLFDGQQIIENIPPLGYILGDEGSGAALGKRLIGDILKGRLSRHIRQCFADEYALGTDEIIQRVYREPFPNRFLASFAPFLNKHKEEIEIHELILNEFMSFFNRNVVNYQRRDLSVHFVGSIAVHFSEELEEAAIRCGMRLGTVLQSPLERLENL